MKFDCKIAALLDTHWLFAWDAGTTQLIGCKWVMRTVDSTQRLWGVEHMPMPPRTPWALRHCKVGVQKKSKLPFRLDVVLTLRANRFLGTWLKDWPPAYHRPPSRRVDFDCMVCQVKVSSAGHIKRMTGLHEGRRPCLATYQPMHINILHNNRGGGCSNWALKRMTIYRVGKNKVTPYGFLLIFRPKIGISK